MFSPHTIAPLRQEDLPELSAFLEAGFGLPPRTECVAPGVLQWKYLGPSPFGEAPRSFVARAGGRLVAHLGLCPRSFHAGARSVRAAHLIDWLAAPEHPFAGTKLALRSFTSAEAPYGIGGTEAARAVLAALGFESRARVGIFRKVLRPLHRLRPSGEWLLRRGLAAARDVASTWRHAGRRPARPVGLVRAASFGAEAGEVVARAAPELVYTSRCPDLLNYYLRYPGGNVTGWLVEDEGRVAGFALLNVVRAGALRQARVADCFLDRPDEALWHAALTALAGQARALGADDLLCLASTPWVESALGQAGFRPAGQTDLLVRDRAGLLPRHAPYHLTHLEGDHAYLQ
jgi:hypothetical protein